MKNKEKRVYFVN